MIIYSNYFKLTRKNIHYEESYKIKFETSGAENLVHFEILVNKFEEKKINDFIDTYFIDTLG